MFDLCIFRTSGYSKSDKSWGSMFCISILSFSGHTEHYHIIFDRILEVSNHAQSRGMPFSKLHPCVTFSDSARARARVRAP